MGNVTTHISREEFARTKPWLFDENVTVGNQQTPIVIFVVKAGLTGAFNVFIQRRFNFNVVDEFGNTPLHYAAEKSGVFVNTLVKNGLDPCAQNYKGQTPLISAVLSNKKEHFQLLSTAMFIRDTRFRGPIHHAMGLNDLELIKELVRYTPALPKHWILTYNEPIDYHLNYFANVESFPPVHLSVMSMDMEMVKCILLMGGDVDSEYNGKTARGILVSIGATLRYGGIFPTDICTREEVSEMWSVITDDTNVHRHIDAGADRHTGLLTGGYKCF
jgi:ankyrin repeat protein